MNTTIEERVSLLELQVVDLDEDVDFLFDEQIIQDERLLSLENRMLDSENRHLETENIVEGKISIIFYCRHHCLRNKRRLPKTKIKLLLYCWQAAVSVVIKVLTRGISYLIFAYLRYSPSDMHSCHNCKV